MSLNVVILAAGRGKRMVSRRPKVLHPLAGRPLLEHVIATARALAPVSTCIVYGHGGEEVPAAVAAPDLKFARQEPQLGTGHALLQALPHLGGAPSTLVLYGDVPLVPVETLRALVAAAGTGVGVLTAEPGDPAGYGRIERDTGGGIRAIVEDKDANAGQRQIREINTGILVLPTRHVAGWLAKLTDQNAQGEYYLTDVVRLAIGDGVAVAGLKVKHAWETLGVNSRAELAQLERHYQTQYAARLLDQGVTLTDPARFDVRGELACGAEVRIDANCIFEGKVTLGEGVKIGAMCVLRNVEVGAGTVIEPFTYIDDATIGTGCCVGPYARIRPGTRLAQDVHIGNFVEIKASEIGVGSKANHLTYVGDAVVGRNVNIGAGTITCNYDGASKHRTVIEDDVHIGSDVQLVAPVTIGKGATIGAGTTVWQSVPPGELALNEKSQVTKAGWKRPRKQEKPQK
jgi:bifunctional UDP-N-acetylglucosamine pyrophosphorylase/glucosamine-1-phosphate N-acetyltransferase